MLNIAMGVALIALVLYLQISRGMYRTVKKNANEMNSELDLDSMNSELESDFLLWKAAFRDELRTHLAALQCDNDLFGFALEPAEDLGNLHFITCVGRESTHEDRDSLTQRFTHVEWSGFLPPNEFEKSLQYLEAIGKKYHDLLIDSATSQYTEAGENFRERWYSEILKVMLECDRQGEFGNIWFKIITFSDFYHSIQVRSFLRLNCNRTFATRCSWLVLKRLGYFIGKIIRSASSRVLRIIGNENPG
ncbi:hypothetical protein [Novipirellula caenicola]|uniref:Uncharacterized protein n=1 Tax=Novipirellula caenicola TaxID=1536901 RepID=A0ABP9VVC9_9BACT